MAGGGVICEIVGPAMMDNSTAFSTLGAFVFAILLVVAMTGNSNFAEIQQAALKSRLNYASHINVYICCLSMCFHFMHVLGGLLRADHGMLNKMSFFEYMLTCPWMMLVLVLLGGPKVQGAKYRTVAMSVTVLVLLFGFIASLVTNILFKTTCFMFGVGLFCVIVYIMNRAVVEYSEGKESLFNGSLSAHASWYKTLAKKIFVTWILFPIWWILSPEGFALATESHDVDSCVKLLLNCFAKGLYILYIRKLQATCTDDSETINSHASHSEQKDIHEQGEISSDAMDIESGHLPASLEQTPRNVGKLSGIMPHDFKPYTPTASGRSASKETCSTRASSKEAPKRSSSKESSVTTMEELDSSDSSETELGNEAPPPLDNFVTPRQPEDLEAGQAPEAEQVARPESEQVARLWQEIQLLRSQLKTSQPSEPSSQTNSSTVVGPASSSQKPGTVGPDGVWLEL
jgi:bacteriorhodopsin